MEKLKLEKSHKGKRHIFSIGFVQNYLIVKKKIKVFF
jgi:hypothetical protein